MSRWDRARVYPCDHPSCPYEAVITARNPRPHNCCNQHEQYDNKDTDAHD